MNTKKYDLPMRDFKNRYSETDLPSLIHAPNTVILRRLWTNALLPQSLFRTHDQKLSSTEHRPKFSNDIKCPVLLLN